MADMKPQVYRDPRPAEYFTEFHRAARKKVGWTYNLARVIVSPPTWLLYRARQIDVKNVPKHGAVILAPNHFSQMDHFFVGLYLPRRIRFMAKSQLFGPPVLTYIYKHGGAFPIRRGHRDEEAFATSRAILGRGDCLLVYAEGGRSRSGELGEPKPGIGRIALESGARWSRSPSRARPGAALEAAALPPGDGPVRRAGQLPGRGRALARAPARGRDRDLRPCPRPLRGAGYR